MSLGDKYTLIYEVQASQAKTTLAGLEKQVNNIATKAGAGGASTGAAASKGLAGALTKSNSAAQGLTSSLGNIGGALGVASFAAVGLSMALDTAQAAGHKLLEIGTGILGVYRGVGNTMMEMLSPIESSMIRLTSVAKMTKHQAMDTLHIAQDLVTYTPFQEQQVVGLTEALAIAKVNLQAYNDEQGRALTLATAQTKGWARLDQQTLKIAGTMRYTAATAIADLAAATGQVGPQMEFFVNGMKRALQTGNIGMLKDQVPISVLQAIFETTGNKSRVKAQKAMDNLFKWLSKQGAMGAAAAASNTFEGIKSNFKDLPLTFARAIGGMPGEGGFYDKLKDAFGEFFAVINETLKGEDFKTTVRESFAPVLSFMIDGVKKLGAAIKYLVTFAKEHPQLTKFIVTAGFVAGIVATITGAMLVLATVAIPALLTAMTAVAALVITMVSPALRTLVLAVGAAFGAIIAAGYAVYKAYESNFGGVKRLFSQVKAFVMGLKEAFQNWGQDSTQISAETGKALQDAGIMDFFVDVLAWLNRVDHFGRAMWKALSEGATSSWKRVEKPLGKVSDSLEKLWNQVKKILVMFGAWNSAAEVTTTNADNAGTEWGNALAGIIDSLATMAILAIDFTTYMVDGINFVLDAVYEWGDEIRTIWNIMSIGMNILFLMGEVIHNTITTPFKNAALAAKALTQAVSGDLSAATETLGKLDMAGFKDNLKDAAEAWRDIKVDMKDIEKAQAAPMKRKRLEAPTYTSEDMLRNRTRFAEDSLFRPPGWKKESAEDTINAMVNGFKTVFGDQAKPQGFQTAKDLKIVNKVEATFEMDKQVIFKIIREYENEQAAREGGEG